MHGQSPQSELIQTCSVPLMKCRWPDASDFNACLSEVILSRAKRESGVTISNVGGWHSDKNLQDWGEDCIRHLVDHMRQISLLMTEALYPEYLEQLPDGWHLEAWANVNGPGSFNKSHDHTADGNIWSGIYYVKTDTPGNRIDPSAGGFTRLENRSLVPVPFVAGQRQRDNEYTIHPEPGLMVLFPATLRHYVELYRGNGARITVAFNLRHPSFTILRYEDMKEPNWRWRNFRGPMMAYSWATRLLARLFS